MGDWVYYIGLLRMEDIAERISVAEEIHSSKSLRDLLQRQLTDRSSEISKYLLSQQQRFFNAIVVGTYGGNPKWGELVISDKKLALELPDYIEGMLGILTLDGTEKLFAIDGQHRVSGIRQAVKDDPSLSEEEVCVIFVSSVSQEHRSRDLEGFQRTRRLFSTLNRYAKPVGKKEIIALDEDDAIAIITRWLVEENPLFQDKISLKQTKSIPVSDNVSFTSIVTLYDVLDIYLQEKGWKFFKRFRPPEDKLKELYQKSNDLWEILVDNFKCLKELQGSSPADEVAGKYRNRNGGNLLFRPIGLLIFVKVLRHQINSGLALNKAVKVLSKVPMEISENPWLGLLWDAKNRRMITAGENQKAAVKLLFYSVGGKLSILKSSKEDLINEIAGLLNKEKDEIELPRYVPITTPVRRRRKL
ncbi:MAG: DGQHR domain-containing protein [Candidatus Hodarchaeota archaeon]